MNIETYNEIADRMRRADERYGNFASTHEMLGVALEEWDELKDEVRQNDLENIAHECLDLAAVLIRFVDQIGDEAMMDRSVK